MPRDHLISNHVHELEQARDSLQRINIYLARMNRVVPDNPESIRCLLHPNRQALLNQHPDVIIKPLALASQINDEELDGKS